MRFGNLTLAEVLIAAALTLIALVTITSFIGGRSATDLCQWRGGVPITDRDGHLTRCDFPLTVYR